MTQDLVRGTIDMHVHASPDVAPRKTDDLELARSAAQAGMGGFLLKAHQGSTVERAYLVQKVVPDIRVFGSLVLNYTVGGLNPNAVDFYVRLGAKEVWMPSLSAEYTITYQRSHLSTTDLAAFNKAHGGSSASKDSAKWGGSWPWSRDGHGISVFGEDGKLVHEVWNILEILAPRDVILGTGHLSPAETFALVEAAQQTGVKRILVTHPEYMAPLTVEEQVTLARKGVFFERCFVCTTPSSKIVGAGLPFEVIVKNIRAVGVDSTVLGTDFGQADNVHPVIAMKDYLQQLSEAGFTDKEIESMAITTPKYLLNVA
jgi:hypothetical protein